MKTELRLHCLKKVNKTAKIFGALKQMAYDTGDYGKCGNYKKSQQELYLLKGLTLLNLEEDGILSRDHRAVDTSTGTRLETFVDASGYKFHSISADQEPTPADTAFEEEIDRSGDLFPYYPYAKYIYKCLSPEYKKLYQYLAPAEISSRKFYSVIDTLTEVKIKGDVTVKWYGDEYRDFVIDLRKDGIELISFRLRLYGGEYEDYPVVNADGYIELYDEIDRRFMS